MAVGILGTAVSGLQVFQRSISVAGHNINNANTEGYTRQRVELGTRPPSFTGQGFIGNGVQIESIDRLFSQFAVDRLRDTTSTSSRYETLFGYSSRVANLFGDSDAGLNAGLESFFNSVQTVADDPASITARQLMLSEAESLVVRFQSLNSQVDSLRDETNGTIANLVNEINGLTAAIADTNRSIVDATSQASGQPPNDLLDKRDTLINKLSELVTVHTVEQDDGAVNVFVGSGQSLVTRFLASPLQAVRNDFDSRRVEIALTGAGATAVISDSMTGGQLGAMLDFRDQVLNPAQNGLGRIAISLAATFNEQHRLGMDLDGNVGADFFQLTSPLVSAHASNAGTATVDASFDLANIGDLTTEDYVLQFDGGSWALSTSSGQAVALTGSGTAVDPFRADGLSLEVLSGTPAVGDRYLIKPTRDGGANTALLLSNARAIAAASPVRITEAVNANGLPTNTGSGEIQLQSVDSGFASLVSGLTFTYDDLGKQFNYTGDATGSIVYDPATDSGNSFTVAGVSFTVTGVPLDPDSFRFDSNTNGSGDNSNALRLAGLQVASTMESGAASYQGAYGQLVGQLGTQTRSAQITAEAQASLQAQAQASRDSISGVNLDEEAANLLRFQQAYQAIAQVISAAETTFQTLLSAIGR